MKADDYKYKVKVNIKVKCNTGPSELFTDTENCTNKATTYVFGVPYCKECASELVRIHKLMNSPK